MDKRDVIAVLRQHEPELRARGVLRAALFGSRARDAERPDSDIDILVDLDPGTVRDIYTYVGLKTFIADLFQDPVDVVDRQALKPHVSPVDGDAIYAF